MNIMSTQLFEKLCSGKHKTQTLHMFPLKVEGLEFRGQFTTVIKANNRLQHIGFFVREGSEDYVILCRKTARSLAMIDA